MRATLVGALLLLCLTAPASAHRLDQYLIDTTLSVRPDRVEAEMRLTPGIAVVSTILTDIDANGDGSLADPEQLAYARRVLRDVSLSLDGKPLQPRLVSTTYPSIEEMREGVGEIVLRFDARLPRGGPSRTLSLETHHHPEIAAYMVNALVTTDPGLRVDAQQRSPDQSTYHLDYTQGVPAAGPATAASWSTLPLWMAADAIALACLGIMFWRRRRWNPHRVS